VEPAFPALTVYTNGITEDRQRNCKIADASSDTER